MSFVIMFTNLLKNEAKEKKMKKARENVKLAN